MSQRRVEISVGVFVLAASACVVYLALVLGKVGGLAGGGYLLTAEFTSVEGLRPGAPVEIAGVPVGRVADIALSQDRARVTLELRSDVAVDRDAICSVRSKGIIGEKFLRLEMGGAQEKIKPGGKIRETNSSVDLQDVISQFVHGKI